MKNRKRSRNVTTRFVMFFVLGLLFLLTLLEIFLYHGGIWNQIFFYDEIDTGMDFFHSIEYTRGRSPYNLYHTLYPPLANLFFYFMFRLVPLSQAAQWKDSFIDGVLARTSNIDLRVHQATLMLFMIFVVTVIVAMILLINHYYDEKNAIDIICAFMTSFALWYGVERGNIVLMVVFFSAFFLWKKDSDNRIISELALLSLAVAAGIKLYPALLGLILIYDKEYKKAVRTVIYGLLFFVMPSFVFHEGISCIPKFLKILGEFSNNGVVDIYGVTFDKLLVNLFTMFSNWFGVEMPVEFLLKVAPKFNYIYAILLLICGFVLKEKWKKVLCCTMAMICYQSQALYVLVMLFIPLLMLVKEEKIVRKNNVHYLILLLLTQSYIPTFGLVKSRGVFLYTRFQIVILVIVVCIFYDTIKKLIYNRNKVS